MFLRYVEIVLIILALVLFISEVLVPLTRGTKVFPTFRRQGKLQNKLADVKQTLAEKNIEQRITELVNTEAPRPAKATPIRKPKGKKKS